MMIEAGPSEVAARFRVLLDDERAKTAARTGLKYLDELFGGWTTTGMRQMAVSALAGGIDEQTIRTLAPAYVSALLNEL